MLARTDTGPARALLSDDHEHQASLLLRVIFVTVVVIKVAFLHTYWTSGTTVNQDSVYLSRPSPASRACHEMTRRIKHSKYNFLGTATIQLVAL